MTDQLVGCKCVYGPEYIDNCMVENLQYIDSSRFMHENTVLLLYVFAYVCNC